jgi:hypothetical protein
MRRVVTLLDRRPVAGIALAIVTGLVAASALRPIWDPDVGWHLALGRTIVEQRSVPDAEPFTHTARGAPMVAHEWASQVVYHAVVEAAGVRGLRVAHAAFVGLLLLLFFGMLRTAGVSPALAVVGVFAWALIAQSRFAIRPQMLSLCFAMCAFHALFVRKPALTDRQLAGLYAVTVVWANLHSAALLLPALLAIYVAVEAVARGIGMKVARPDELGGGSLPRLALATGLTGLAVFVTPHHFRLIPYVLESNRINSRLSGEWFSILEYWGLPGVSAGELGAVAVVAVSAVVAAIPNLRRGSFGIVGVVMFVTCLPLGSQRFVDLYFAPILFSLAELARWSRASRLGATLRDVVALAGLALALCVTPLVLAPGLEPDRVLRWLGTEANFEPVAFPVGAVRFLDEVDLESRIFNPAGWGGYVLLHTYQKYPVFIDGRWVTVGERVTRDALRIERRLPVTFDKLDAYGVDLLLVPRGWMTDRIAEERGWIPVFENWNAGVYLRGDPANAENLGRCADYHAARGIPFDPPADSTGAPHAAPIASGLSASACSTGTSDTFACGTRQPACLRSTWSIDGEAASAARGSKTLDASVETGPAQRARRRRVDGEQLRDACSGVPPIASRRAHDSEVTLPGNVRGLHDGKPVIARPRADRRARWSRLRRRVT